MWLCSCRWVSLATVHALSLLANQKVNTASGRLNIYGIMRSDSLAPGGAHSFYADHHDFALFSDDLAVGASSYGG